MPENSPKLGELIVGNWPGRDAIHIAVAPVIATEKLYPGQGIGFRSGSRTDVMAGGKDITLGIVDPFLTAPVFPGEQFWMFLFPNTITSLRHHWTHPAWSAEAFAVEPEQPASTVAAAINLEQVKLEAVSWMQSFASEAGLDYDTVIQGAKKYLETGLVYVQRDSQAARDAYNGLKSPQDFWSRFTAITGITVPDEEIAEAHTPFCCNC